MHGVNLDILGRASRDHDVYGDSRLPELE